MNESSRQPFNADPAQNVDPAEIAKFEALADRWWDPSSEFKPLHDINPLRLGFINQRAPLTGKTVADIGCGGGILSESMARTGATVTGIDMTDQPLAVARRHAEANGISVNYRQCTAEALAAEEAGLYDVVTCLEMLEHVPDPSSVIRACYQLAKPGGHVFFSTINRNPKSFLFAIVGAEHILRLLPKGTHEYAKLIRPSELSRWIRETDLQLQEFKGMTYNPFTNTYALGDNISVNYLAHCIKPEL